MRHHESELQSACVRWFRLQYRRYERLLFAVPNGSHRNRVTAAILKGEGVLAGVSDLILLIPNSEYTALCIEMKSGAGRQIDSQRQFQQAAESVGNRYVVIRSFDEFKSEIDNYLRGL